MRKLFLSFCFLFAMAILIFSSQTSCKKETIINQVTATDTVQVTTTDTVYQCPASIHGLWVGTYTVDDAPALGAQYYSFIIKSDGTLIVDGKGGSTQYMSQGTWTLTGSSLACDYTCFYCSAPPSQVGVSQTATGSFDVGGNLISGTWNTPSSSSNNTGTFTLTKVN
ncbi:MAG: hypothetical protein QM737_22905 [Ferruginibacter sp.]